uniref:Uncharacterized protein n=1 Tax=Micrurus paraensis TaxID=1970185 RepID=A0A2D4K7W7_9SAUR
MLDKKSRHISAKVERNLHVIIYTYSRYKFRNNYCNLNKEYNDRHTLGLLIHRQFSYPEISQSAFKRENSSFRMFLSDFVQLPHLTLLASRCFIEIKEMSNESIYY